MCKLLPRNQDLQALSTKRIFSSKKSGSLNEILPAFSISYTSVVGNEIFEHEFFFLSCKFLLPAPTRLSVDFMLAKPKTGQGSVLVPLSSLRSLLAL